MAKFWQNQKFKELQNKWYERLKDSGFTDAERIIAGELTLIQKASNSYRQGCAEVKEAKARYFELLAQYVHQEKFENEVERLVMQRRAEGVRIVQISQELKGLGKRPSHREILRFIIRKYELKWKIRRWNSSQLKRA